MDQLPRFGIVALGLTKDERLRLHLVPEDDVPLNGEAYGQLKALELRYKGVRPQKEERLWDRLQTAMTLLAERNFTFTDRAESDAWEDFINRYPIESFHYFWNEINTEGIEKGKRKFLEKQLEYAGSAVVDSLALHVAYLHQLSGAFSKESGRGGISEAERILTQAIIGIIHQRIHEFNEYITADYEPQDIIAGNYTRSSSRDPADRFMQPERGRRGSKR